MSDASLKSKLVEPDGAQSEEISAAAAKKARKKLAKQEALAAMSSKEKDKHDKRLAQREAMTKTNKKLKAKGKMTKKEAYKARKAELKAAKAEEKAKLSASKAPKKRQADGTPDTAEKKQKLDPLAVRCFVTGLSYRATEQHVIKHFEEVGAVSVEILRDQNTGKSNGTAFLTFETAEQAAEAGTYTGSEILKRWIKVRHCEVRENDKVRAKPGPGEKPAGCESIVMTGLPPTVEDDDLWAFFEDLEVNSISRMMDRDTGKFRGMAFIDFASTDGVDMAIKKQGQPLKGSSSYRIRYKVEKSDKAHNSGTGRIAAHNQAPKVPDWKGTRKTLDSDSDDE